MEFPPRRGEQNPPMWGFIPHAVGENFRNVSLWDCSLDVRTVSFPNAWYGLPKSVIRPFCVVFYNCLPFCVIFYKKFPLTADNSVKLLSETGGNHFLLNITCSECCFWGMEYLVSTPGPQLLFPSPIIAASILRKTLFSVCRSQSWATVDSWCSE